MKQVTTSPQLGLFVRLFAPQHSSVGKMYIELLIVAAVWWLMSGTAKQNKFVATGFRKMFYSLNTKLLFCVQSVVWCEKGKLPKLKREQRRRETASGRLLTGKRRWSRKIEKIVTKSK